MERIYKSLTELIGNTPIVELTNIEKREKLEARLLVKIESFNPGGSAKDRIAYAMIEDAENRGLIREGATIIEPTSGNTGVGLAWVCAVKGYRAIFTMPDTMSVERQNLLRAFGAEVILTPGKDGMKGAIIKAEELHSEMPNSIIPGQFDNPVNREVHKRTTGEEIWRDTGGNIDIYVAGVGTGGTLTGTGETLKRYKKEIEVVAVEPETSAVLSGEKPGGHKIQGIGAGFIPGNYHSEFVDKIEKVSDKEAYETARLLASKEGILAGISSGAAVAVAIRLAKKDINKGKTILAVLPDTGERYLSTGLFSL